jgi:hypothetical protein
LIQLESSAAIRLHDRHGLTYPTVEFPLDAAYSIYATTFSVASVDGYSLRKMCFCQTDVAHTNILAVSTDLLGNEIRRHGNGAFDRCPNKA